MLLSFVYTLVSFPYIVSRKALTLPLSPLNSLLHVKCVLTTKFSSDMNDSRGEHRPLYDVQVLTVMVRHTESLRDLLQDPLLNQLKYHFVQVIVTHVSQKWFARSMKRR